MQAIVITALVIYCFIGAALWILSPWWRDKGGEAGTQRWNPVGVFGSAVAWGIALPITLVVQVIISLVECKEKRKR